MSKGPELLFSGSFRLFDSSVPALNPATSLTPASPPVSDLSQARVLKQQGRLDEALAQCRQALVIHPDHVDCLLLAAEIYLAQGDRDSAFASYSRVVELRPDQPLAHYKRGNLRKDRGELEAALADYDQAILLDPRYGHALANRGFVLCRLNRLPAALESYDRAVTVAPDDALAFCNRAEVLRKLRRPVEALASYDRAISIQPNHLDSHFNRGLLLNEMGQYTEALVNLDKAAALAPDYAETHLARANALERLRRYTEAIEAYERVLAIQPDFRFVRGLRLHHKMQICGWDGLDADIERLVAAIRRGERVCPPFAFLSMVDDPALHRQAAQIWVRAECPASPDPPALPPRAKSDKLRIGYFSVDFGEHPVSILTAELFELHDRSCFEITAFSLGPDKPSPLRTRLEKAFDRFLDVHASSDRDVTQLARAHEIDVAVDLTGHTENSRTKIFAERAAPIQIAYLGYPGTMGADYIDYVIGDPTVIPIEDQAHYREKIIHLRHSYLPNDSTRTIDAATPAREQAGLPAEGFVFCCFNNSYKLAPEVFSSWMRILTRAQRSVLWLSRQNPLAAANLRREAAQRGVDPRRLIFAERVPSSSQHLARLRLADLCLDTLPYNAHATAIDALWSGLPVLTRVGRAFAGRVGASLLRAIELPELVTESAQQYEDLAVELAENPLRMAQIKQQLVRNRTTTTLFDSRSFVRQLQTAYTEVYERYRAGLPPEHILI